MSNDRLQINIDLSSLASYEKVFSDDECSREGARQMRML